MVVVYIDKWLGKFTILCHQQYADILDANLDYVERPAEPYRSWTDDSR